MYCFFYQDLQVLNYQCLAFCLSGATKRVIRIKEQPHPQLYTAKIKDISVIHFWQNKTASIYLKRTVISSSRSRCQCCNLKTMKFFSGWLYEEEESEGMFYPLVPVMQPLPVRQWNLFAANSKSWEWHENWQNKYAGARPKKDGVILRGQLVTFFHSLYLTTKNALPWSKINYGLELVIPWKQTILYHGTGHTKEATIP